MLLRAVSLEYEAGKVFKGFMVQARSGEGQVTNSSTGQGIVGRFLQGDDYKTLDCSALAVSYTHKHTHTIIAIL